MKKVMTIIILYLLAINIKSQHRYDNLYAELLGVSYDKTIETFDELGIKYKLDLEKILYDDKDEYEVIKKIIFSPHKESAKDKPKERMELTILLFYKDFSVIRQDFYSNEALSPLIIFCNENLRVKGNLTWQSLNQRYTYFVELKDTYFMFQTLSGREID